MGIRQRDFIQGGDGEMTEPRQTMEDESLLEIMEYERELTEELNRAKEEAARIVETARQRAKESVERAKEQFAVLDKEYGEKLKAELEREARAVLRGKEEKLRQTQNIGKGKIEELVGLALKRITGI